VARGSGLVMYSADDDDDDVVHVGRTCVVICGGLKACDVPTSTAASKTRFLVPAVMVDAILWRRGKSASVRMVLLLLFLYQRSLLTSRTILISSLAAGVSLLTANCNVNVKRVRICDIL